MRPTSFPADRLLSLLRKQKVATMDELKHALGTNTDSTVFRKLAELAYRTSYSHRGRFYTLDETARFDQAGLWSFRQIWFSQHGTLTSTVAVMVEQSVAGYHADELASVLHVEVKAALVKLVRQNRLARTQVGRRWLYHAAQPAPRRAQLTARQVHQADPTQLGLGGGVQVLPDELKAAIVLFYGLLNEQQRRLYAGLEALKVGHAGTGASPTCSVSTRPPWPPDGPSCSPVTGSPAGPAAPAVGANRWKKNRHPHQRPHPADEA